MDDNKIPEKINWHASDAHKESTSKAIMVSVWDAQASNTLRIDLWTKDMMVDEMKQFYHQSFLSMADAFERSTSEVEAAKAIRNFAQEFGLRMKLVMENKLPALGA